MNFNCSICGEILCCQSYIDNRKFIECVNKCDFYGYSPCITFKDNIIVGYFFPIKYNNNYYLLQAHYEYGTAFETIGINEEGEHHERDVIYDSYKYIQITSNKDIDYLANKFLKLQNF